MTGVTLKGDPDQIHTDHSTGLYVLIALTGDPDRTHDWNHLDRRSRPDPVCNLVGFYLLIPFLGDPEDNMTGVTLKGDSDLIQTDHPADFSL